MIQYKIFYVRNFPKEFTDYYNFSETIINNGFYGFSGYQLATNIVLEKENDPQSWE